MFECFCVQVCFDKNALHLDFDERGCQGFLSGKGGPFGIGHVRAEARNKQPLPVVCC